MHIADFDNMFHIDQDFFMIKIEHITSEVEFSKSACMRMKLAWLASTKSNIVFEISQTAQESRAMYEKGIIKQY